MTNLLIQSEYTPFLVDLSSVMAKNMSEEQFYQFCCSNRDLRIERTSEGEIIVMPPVFADTGNRNSRIIQQLLNWSDQTESGEVFDSSAGFTLPNGATRSPDAAWIRSKNWATLTVAEQASFAPICPDFVVKLRSASDALSSLQNKMQEYMENGAQLGLLIDRKQQTVHVYRPERSPEILKSVSSVDCRPELEGFTLQMEKIW